jgi:pimeloyl-ACP methyl ester carboxylesterase
MGCSPDAVVRRVADRRPLTQLSGGRREMPTVEIRDTTLYYESAGGGVPLLFIHGMCGDADVWRGQVRRLADRFRCVTYDRRGHTRSAVGDEAESVATHTEDAAALIVALGVRPIVVGSSGGARIAVELCRRYPGLLAGAVLSEPPIFSLDQGVGNALLAELGAVVGPVAAKEGPRAAVDAFFALVCPGLWSALDEDAKDRYRANAHMMLAEFGGPRYHLTVENLSAIGVPALVIAGTTSLPALRSIAHVLAHGLPHARLVELQGSGHVTYAERPDEFAAAVATFAAGLQPAAA